MEVTFDPARISFTELLDVYWRSFPFYIPPGPPRVRTAILPRGPAQAAAAAASKRRTALLSGETVYPDVIPDGAFWPAERMHQKFHLQRVHPDLVDALAGEGDIEGFLGTTAASRLNAYVDGLEDPALLVESAERLGWTVDDLQRRLQTPSPVAD